MNLELRGNNKNDIALLKKKLKRLTEDLEELESYIESLSRFLPTPVAYIGVQGSIIEVNQAFEKLTGYSTIEIVGKSIDTIFFDKKKGSILTQRTLDKGYIESLESFIVNKKENKKIPVSISTMIRRDGKGEKDDAIGYFISFIDITESQEYQEKLERTVRERTKELQKEVEELEKFYKLTIGRELKMVELKKEIERLKKSENVEV